jgi:hypothetical protein
MNQAAPEVRGPTCRVMRPARKRVVRRTAKRDGRTSLPRYCHFGQARRSPSLTLMRQTHFLRGPERIDSSRAGHDRPQGNA